MNSKIIKAPYGFPAEAVPQNILRLNGLTILETCASALGSEGRLFLQEHFLLIVLSGTYTVCYGSEQIDVKRNELVLLEKAKVVEYQKSGEYEGELLNYWMFFLGDDLLKEFALMAKLNPVRTTGAEPVHPVPVNERLLTYLESLKPYFNEHEVMNDHLIKMKLLELLYGLAAADNNLMKQLLQISHPLRIPSLAALMEEYVFAPVSLSDLAYLSGRSLSSFKRDFNAVYQMTPSRWIRQRRVSKAKELLTGSAYSVTDICFMTGYESPAHFSRVFKEVTGLSPAAYRQQSRQQTALYD
ncbi:helix-turn-helix domain-containing protein [Paenibacillus terreus]|uniref:Helix-turn-helix domain-containing protein n=1 Tax=Paenibacillus terreus TaxID=1387834 RepID=A0ABV5BF00_9BACL